MKIHDHEKKNPWSGNVSACHRIEIKVTVGT